MTQIPNPLRTILPTAALLLTALTVSSCTLGEDASIFAETVTFNMIYTDAKGEVVLDEAAALGDGAKYYANAAGDGIFVVMPPALDETCLKNIETSFSQGTGAPIYIMTFKKPCAETLGEVTGKNVGKQMAIIINGTLISAPIIQEAITGGSLVIEGGA